MTIVIKDAGVCGGGDGLISSLDTAASSEAQGILKEDVQPHLERDASVVRRSGGGS